MTTHYLLPDQQYVFRVVDSKGNPLKTRMSGSSSHNPQYTVRTYQTGAAAAGVANRKNNDLGYEEYSVEVSAVTWHKFNQSTSEVSV